MTKNPAFFIGLFLVTASPAIVQAAIIGPYAVDSNTKFLWHLDEASGSSNAAGAVGGTNSLLAVNGGGISSTSALPANTSMLGTAGFSGFGNAATVSTTNGLAYDATGDSQFNPDFNVSNPSTDAIATSSFTGAGGAFTLEAMVNFSSLTSTSNREIISMENSGANAVRPFQLVVTTDAKLRYRDLGNNLTFEIALPTSGADVFTVNTWFHAAYAYDGDGNGTLYWTKLDAGRTAASVLGTSASQMDLTGNASPLVIGNENRSSFGEGLIGSIDEVRISDIARSADGFLFAVPEPSSILTAAFGALILMNRRKRI